MRRIRRTWAHVLPHTLQEGDIVADHGKVVEWLVQTHPDLRTFGQNILVEVRFLSGEIKTYEYTAQRRLDASVFWAPDNLVFPEDAYVFAFTGPARPVPYHPDQRVSLSVRRSS